METLLIHDVNGNRRPIPYSIYGDCTYFVSRKFLNQSLLTLAETVDNVTIHSQHKVLNVSVENAKCHFQLDNSINETIEASVVIGTDGTCSEVRSALIKSNLVKFSQAYIDHGYLELSIAPKSQGDFAMEANYL